MFYQKVRKICKEKGTSVTRMVKDLGLSSGNVTNWKNGRLPKTEIAFKIANYLDVSVYSLIGEIESRPINDRERNNSIVYANGTDKHIEAIYSNNNTLDDLTELVQVVRKLPNEKIKALLNIAKLM